MKRLFILTSLLFVFIMLANGQVQHKKTGQNQASVTKVEKSTTDTVMRLSKGGKIVDYILSHSKFIGGIVYAVLH